MTTKRKQHKSVEKPRRLPPIVVVPDKTYIDDTGNVISTDVILIADLEMYERMKAVLEAWEQELIKKIADNIIQERREQEFRVGEGM